MLIFLRYFAVFYIRINSDGITLIGKYRSFHVW